MKFSWAKYLKLRELNCITSSGLGQTEKYAWGRGEIGVYMNIMFNTSHP